MASVYKCIKLNGLGQMNQVLLFYLGIYRECGVTYESTGH